MSFTDLPGRMARRLWRPLRRRMRSLFPGGIVLLYHRVAALDTDPQWLAVPPPLFDEHLEAISRVGHPMSLADLAKAAEAGRVPRRAIAITFDDGYLDNLERAKPLLEQHGIPATVFVTTGTDFRSREPFWDELDRILLQPRDLPPLLCVRIGGQTHEWSLSTRRSEERWTVAMPPRAPVDQAYVALCALLKPLCHEERTSILDDVRAQTGCVAEVRPSHAMMTPAQWCELEQGGLIAIGAHTQTHPMLSSLPAAAQETEIRNSKTDLENAVGHPVRAMAYPFGTRADYDDVSVRVAREAGFDAACSNFPGVVRRGVGRFQLPRFLVRDWTADDLAARIEHWFAG